LTAVKKEASMELQIQDLVSSIRKEGIDAAQAEAAAIIEEAKKKAESIVAQANAEAKSKKEATEREIGILKEGAAADVIVMDYKPFTPFSDENIDGHMIFGMMGKNCRTTIINGKVLYKDREFVGIDEEAINAWTLEQSKKLWGELNHREY
jgi:cytosine/adenosine deaminase-related metal-dependent hydrolase